MKWEYVRGNEFLNGVRVVKRLCTTDDYAIYRLEEERYGLCVSENVATFWKEQGYISEEAMLQLFRVLDDNFCYMTDSGYKLYTPMHGPYFETLDEGLEFAVAFKKYVEQYQSDTYPNLVFLEKQGLMLPLPSQREQLLSAEVCMGEWVADGIPLDIRQTDKIRIFCDGLDEEGINCVAREAGIGIGKPIFQKSLAIDKEKEDSVQYENFKLPGRENLTQIFNEQIIDFFRQEDKYRKMGISSLPATLLYGPPGSGKSYAVQQLVNFLKLPYFEINSSTVASPYIHDTSKKIAEVFQKAIENAPSVLVIDEIEAYVGKRSESKQKFEIEEVDEFLRNIPKAIDHRVIVFGMTNHLDLIDSAILRKGRFDQLVEVGMPNRTEIMAVLRAQLMTLPVANDLDLKRYATQLEGYPLSDVAFIIRESGRLAVRMGSEKITDEIVSHILEKSILSKQKKEEHRSIGFGR